MSDGVSNDLIIRLITLFNEIWGSNALAASVTTFASVCSESQLQSLADALENAKEVKKAMDQHPSNT